MYKQLLQQQAKALANKEEDPKKKGRGTELEMGETLEKDFLLKTLVSEEGFNNLINVL